MKKEEQLLRALGNVKDSYVLEPSRYLGNPQKFLTHSKKKRWTAFSAMAAAAALVLTGAVSLNLLLNRGKSSEFIPLSNRLKISDRYVRQVSFLTSETKQNPRAVQKIQVCLGEDVTQTIDESCLPSYEAGKNEGMFLSAVDINDLPSDIPSCNQGLFFEDGDGTIIRTDVDFRDVNFDGYADLGLAAVKGYPDNLPYNYLCWNPETEQYEYGFTLYGGAALEVDEKREMLIETVVENGEPSKRYYQFTGGTLQITTEQTTLPEGWPGFQIEYDQELIEMVRGTDGLYLYPIEYSEELPVCEIKIEFLPNLLPYAAMEQSRKEMADDQTTIHQDQEMLRYLFVVSHGTAWNSRVEEVLIVGAGSAGSYRLTSKYFVEAAEGWGMTFSQICSSFSCTWADSPHPEAEKVIMDFAEGYFSANQAAMLANYYGDSQNLRDMYTQDPSRVRIVSLQGLDEMDSSIAHSGVAYISLAFLETEQRDSYTYLSMEVMKTRAGYRVSSYGLEK